MEGTRQYILKEIMSWVTNDSGKKEASNAYWIHGSPGIGKTTLAHSICAGLHKGKHLAGAFFCRNEQNMNEPRSILRTFIYNLAVVLPPFRNIVADSLRNDPNLTSDSMEYTLFLNFLSKLPPRPERTLVFVIDALDECGNNQSRNHILTVLANAVVQAPWLKIIITSRPESDIQRFFDQTIQSPHLRYNLTTDDHARTDLEFFAQSKFKLVASESHIETTWPEESLFNRVISQADGLFIFIETIVLTLEGSTDPTKSLEATLQDSASTGLKPLYGLYLSILREKIQKGHTEFRQMMGAILSTAAYRPLCDKTLAKLADVEHRVIKIWMDRLNSLLYRDEGANGGVRVRHLSISEFFMSNHCDPDHRIHLGDANVQLGISCLRTMIHKLRFNICKLEDSQVANTEIKDLPSRIKYCIPDELQYSSLYWSNHICPPSVNGISRALGSLAEFFEGLYPLYWIEVLSLMGMVPIGVPSLRQVIPLIKVGQLQPVFDLHLT